jgi:hypothetical protein
MEANVYANQKGMLPLITSLLGILIPCAFFINAISILFPGFASSIDSKSFDFVIIKTIELLVGLALYLFFPFLFGIFFSGLFPAINVDKNGLKYKYLGGLIQKKIKWKEIDRYVEIPLGFTAIVINRPGFTLFNGLYWNRIYGRLLGIGRPVILLSPKINNYVQILKEIDQKA